MTLSDQATGTVVADGVKLVRDNSADTDRLRSQPHPSSSLIGARASRSRRAGAEPEGVTLAGISMLMRHVSSGDVARGLAHLEAGFEATLNDDVYDAETESGQLCDLGEEWCFVQPLVTGKLHQGTDVSDLPVLGGRSLGQVGPTDRDLILLLSPDEVAAAADHLRNIDVLALMAANRGVLAERTGGVLPEPWLRRIAAMVVDLQRFYLAAAESGRAVVKRMYTP